MALCQKMKISDLIKKTEETSEQDFQEFPQKEQVKLMAYYFLKSSNKTTFKINDIKKCFEEENLHLPSNISREIHLLNKSKDLIKKSDRYWALHRTTEKKLDGISLGSESFNKVKTELSSLMKNLKNNDQKEFLREAITCLQTNSIRASIVMTWLLTIDILYEYIVKNKLEDFNSALKKDSSSKSKKIITKKEDFNEIKDVDFIRIMRSVRIIDKNQKKILDQKLEFRNIAAHPNSIKITRLTVYEYIQNLMDNIIVNFT